MEAMGSPPAIENALRQRRSGLLHEMFRRIMIGGALEFTSTANARPGWLQIAPRVESCVWALVAQSRAA
jgi:hypothetical protein